LAAQQFKRLAKNVAQPGGNHGPAGRAGKVGAEKFALRHSQASGQQRGADPGPKNKSGEKNCLRTVSFKIFPGAINSLGGQEEKFAIAVNQLGAAFLPGKIPKVVAENRAGKSEDQHQEKI
jgi:hypothetical protein